MFAGRVSLPVTWLHGELGLRGQLPHVARGPGLVSAARTEVRVLTVTILLLILNIFFRAVSLDSSSKARRFLDILTSTGRSYFWTSGFKTRASSTRSGETVGWANGASTRPRRGSYPWSVFILI